MTRLQLLRGDRAGVTAVEFALVAPVLLLLLCGSVEMGNMLFARVMLEGAVVDAARIATASLESGQAQRDAAMRLSIGNAMRAFPIAPGRSIQIRTRVFRDFSSAYPEPYQDTNRNGKYDLGEPYTDRNQNGRWDDTTQVDGSTLGGPGDVVSITAVYPKQPLFGFLTKRGMIDSILTLSATTVVRNETVVRRTS